MTVSEQEKFLDVLYGLRMNNTISVILVATTYLAMQCQLFIPLWMIIGYFIYLNVIVGYRNDLIKALGNCQIITNSGETPSELLDTLKALTKRINNVTIVHCWITCIWILCHLGVLTYYLYKAYNP